MNETLLKSTVLAFFDQAIVMSALTEEAAHGLQSKHVSLGGVHSMKFFAAVGLGDKIVTGVQFDRIPFVSIGQVVGELAASWTDKFVGQTAEETAWLIGNGLEAELAKLQASYEALLKQLQLRPLRRNWDPMYYIRELFQTEDGDVFATIEYYQEEARDPSEAVIYLGQFDRCLRHKIGWFPSIIGFHGYGQPGANADITVYVPADQCEAHDQLTEARAEHALGPVEFRGKPFQVQPLNPPVKTEELAAAE